VTAHHEYFEYLKTRSRLGLLYRRGWLYPRLCAHLSGRVLDVGCGIGDMVAFRQNTVGVDVNSYTVDFCRKRGLDARLMAIDQLPFADAEFDGAICDNVLEHVENPRALLAEMRRVLRPSGRLLLGVPGAKGFASDTDHKVYYEEQSLIQTLQRAGFSLHKIFHVPFRSDWLSNRLRHYCVYGVFTRP
jgi:SAM-dependent methyltransferase